MFTTEVFAGFITSQRVKDGSVELTDSQLEAVLDAETEGYLVKEDMTLVESSDDATNNIFHSQQESKLFKAHIDQIKSENVKSKEGQKESLQVALKKVEAA